MKTGTKFAIAGSATGAAGAVLPIACGVYLSRKRKPLDEHDMLRAENGKFITQDGEETALIGIDLSMPDIRCLRDGEKVSAQTEEIFNELASRFGNYGAREVFGRYFEKHISKPDIKAIKNTGVNCVRIPLYSYLVFKEGKLRKTEPDLERTDKVIEKLRKAGIYTILSLEYTPGFEDGKEDMFVSGSRKGFALRNEAIAMWSKIAAHYKDEPAVAAYDILDRGGLGFECGEDIASFYIRAVKALRNIGDSHIAVLQLSDITPEQEEQLKSLNAVLGIGRKNCSFYEAQAISKNAVKCSADGVAAFITNLRPSSLTSAAGVFEESGVSGIITGYKGSPDSLYSGQGPLIDLKLDTFDSINEKLADASGIKSFSKNKELENELKNATAGIKFKKKKSNPIKIHYSHGKAYFAGI